jgi:hypothetical protein
MAPYEFNTLAEGDQIRLVSLHAGTSETDFEYSITTHTLGQTPWYYALSYFWGSDPNRVAVRCDGGDVLVSQTARDAVTWLRANVRPDTPQHVWIDQMCINQQDLAERAHQVQLMRRIYHGAERTLIWLGSDDHGDAALVSDLVKKVKIAMYDGDLPTVRSVSWAEDKSVAETRSKLGIPDLESPFWSRLSRFTNNPWFRRVWVLQEVAMSAHPPGMICGDVYIDWDDFAEAMSWLALRGYNRAVFFIARAPAISIISSLRENWEGAKNAPRLWTLEAILLLVMTAHATDIHDRVYALLGLTADFMRAYQTSDSILKPDYERDPYEVFAEIARYCIRSSGRLTVLCKGGSDYVTSHTPDTHHTAVPSWVPRWDLPYRDDVFTDCPHSFAPTRNDDCIMIYEVMSFYNASAGTTAELRDHSSTSELTLRGLEIDSIIWVSELFSFGDFKVFPANPVRGVWEHCLKHFGIDADDTDQHFLDFARKFYETMVCGQGPEREPASEEPLDHFWRYISRCYVESAEALDTTDPDIVSMYERLGEPGDVGRCLVYLAGRRMFITKEGHIGLGAGPLAVGDHIAVLFGGIVPFVTRKHDESWQLVGEAYIRDLADGQAVEKWKGGELRDEWFSIT